MKKSLLLSLLLVFSILEITAAGNERNYNFIDADQDRIDNLDGKIDHHVRLGDSLLSMKADRVYFGLADSIQGFIERWNLGEEDKKHYRNQLFLLLRTVRENNVEQVDYFERVFSFVFAELKAVKSGTLYPLLLSNEGLAFQTMNFFKKDTVTERFLRRGIYLYPEKVFEAQYIYADQPYGLHVLNELIKYAPVFAKKYMLPNYTIFESMKKSEDSVAKILLQINDTYGKKSNSFVLIDAIAKNKMTIAKADSIGKSQREYLRAMMHIRSGENPMGLYSLEQELEIYSLKYVRVLNDLHNEKEAVRFESVEDFSAEELYTLIVYSEEEVFTSTFNGLFKRLMKKLDKENGMEFLNSMGNNRFRTFIKMCASFSKLKDFLATMPPVQQDLLMIRFASGLESGGGNTIAQAVEVADAYGSISDTALLSMLQRTIEYEYSRVEGEKNKKAMALYGLLSRLFAGNGTFHADWFKGLAEQYKLPPIDRIPSAKLFEKNGANVWQMYFYDDEDGDASFKNFIAQFHDKNWVVHDEGLYVKIVSATEKKVLIYANKPKDEYEGQELVENLLDSLRIEPDVMVHRGHSYYAYKTIAKIKASTSIFVLGSCGGYHSLSGIIDRAPGVNIISSKQIGTMTVNNPMVKLLADNIREGVDVDWQVLWKKLDAQLKPNADAYGRFLDYIPPHKNLGAIFIRAYNNLVQGGE